MGCPPVSDQAGHLTINSSTTLKKRIFITGGSGFIGINLIEELISLGHHICNFDLQQSPKESHREYWHEGDLMDASALAEAVREFDPQWVIHLGGRTDCDENTTVEEGYQANTTGTKNLLTALKDCKSLERAIITSSQYVCGPGKLPESDDDYFPHTVYGQSKVETEKMTRSSGIPGIWTLIRPVNIWGPYHVRYSKEFWRIASLGLYIHPNVPSPTRTYGYVGNVVWQIIELLKRDSEEVHQKVFYVGDPPIRIDRWSLAFNKKLSGRDAVRLPLWVMKLLAATGDLISIIIRRPFFLTSSRLRSMTIDYPAPMEPTMQLLGMPPYSLEDGIEITVEWYQNRSKKTCA